MGADRVLLQTALIVMRNEDMSRSADQPLIVIRNKDISRSADPDFSRIMR